MNKPSTQDKKKLGLFAVKDLATYFMVLLAVVLVVINIGSIFTDKMVVYIKKDKPDNLQIFFPQKGGSYDEENSQRSGFFDNTKNGVKISLPSKSLDHVRIDPADNSGNIIITKIELKHLFSTETFTPKDLLARAKPLQMIDILKVNEAGLLIHSTGNDPFFELKFNQSPVLFKYIIFGIISILLSLILFFIFKKTARFKIPAKYNKYFLWVIPLLFSIGIALLFYPGFMSYDTLHALRGARNGVTDSMWPPMVSYVWRMVDLISHNPSAMHFSQVFLLLGSIFCIIFFFTKKISKAIIFLFVYLSIPVILGTIAVIWKDVLMASFLFAALAIILVLKEVSNKKRFILLFLLTVFLLFLGVCSRHNAITGAFPLICYLAFITCSSRFEFKHSMHLWLSVVLLSFGLTGFIFGTKIFLDNYSLPSFSKLNNGTDVLIQSVRVLDVAGASECVGMNLFDEMAPNLSMVEIRSLYDPKHINLSAGLLSRVGVDSRINKIWLNVLARHPFCFFNNKFQMTKYLIGANKGDQFIITAPSVDANEYGYHLPESPLRDFAVSYIIKDSNLLFYRPWFIYLLSISAFIYMLWMRVLTADYLIIFISAVFYFASLVLFGNAADARLLFYTTTALAIFIFISILEFIKRHK